MSYRAFKRLLGETSLERKCRFLFGAGILVLISISFWFYARQTEGVAYSQALKTCRILVNPSLVKDHLKALVVAKYKDEDGKPLSAAQIAAAWNVDDSEKKIFGEGGEYQYATLYRDDPLLTTFERDLFQDFESGEKDEAHRYVSRYLVYYSAVRARKSCLACHQAVAEQGGKLKPRAAGRFQEGELMAIMRINMRTDAIATAVHINRAVLISIALATALLIMTGSWIIVRYVIVKPVKHLKDVSDAISAGELNVRSEIQTGDEFEDLSHAFNRMLRNLVAMQDRLRRVNADLDRKVDQLARANMALYESNRLKSDFLATMSHEFRTPLNSILGFSEVLLSSENLDSRQRRWVSNIKSSGERLLNLVNDILDLAKIESGKMELRIEEFSIQDLFEGQLSMFRQMAEKKSIALSCEIDDAIPVLRQDCGKVQQILQNLLSNAIKFTPEGGKVMLRAERDGDSIRLIVQDTGVGIAPQDRERIFEKFRQAENPLTREHAGSGLGLSIVRELSRLLGGEVTLQSEVGRGSTFIVRIPLAIDPEGRTDVILTEASVRASVTRLSDSPALQRPETPLTQLDRSERTRIDLPKN